MEGYLSDQYVFVYLRTQSELLRDLDRFRELRLDLSKKNRAVPAVCVIVALLDDLLNDQVTSLQRKGIAANLHWLFYRLYFKQSSIDEGVLGTVILFSAVCCDFDSHRYLIKRALIHLHISLPSLKFTIFINLSLLTMNSIALILAVCRTPIIYELS